MVFGAGELDLSASSPGPDACLTVVAILGGLEISVAAGRRVSVGGFGLFGGRKVEVSQVGDGPQLKMNLWVILGGVDVKELEQASVANGGESREALHAAARRRDRRRSSPPPLSWRSGSRGGMICRSSNNARRHLGHRHGWLRRARAHGPADHVAAGSVESHHDRELLARAWIDWVRDFYGLTLPREVTQREARRGRCPESSPSPPGGHGRSDSAASLRASNDAPGRKPSPRTSAERKSQEAFARRRRSSPSGEEDRFRGYTFPELPGRRRRATSRTRTSRGRSGRRTSARRWHA